jgi:hypothetical protein
MHTELRSPEEGTPLSKLHLLPRRGKVLRSGIVGLLVITVALAAIASGAFADASGPALDATGTAGSTTITVSPTTNLVDGQTITIHAHSTGPTFTELRAHICLNTIGTVNSGKFDFTGNFCFSGPDAVTDSSGTTAAPTTHLGTNGDYETFKGYNNRTDSNGVPPETDLTFKAGTTAAGGVFWKDESAATVHNIECNATHTCTLVVQVQSSEGSGKFWFKAPLTYAGPPGAPTSVLATSDEDHQSHLTWGAATGRVDTYLIHTAGTGAPVDFSVPGTQTNALVSGLTNFVPYTFTVSAVNPVATTAGTPANGTPRPGAPGTPVVTLVGPGTHSLNIDWTAPTSTDTPDDYFLQVFISHVANGSPIDTGSTSTHYTLGGLADGTLYSFQVFAHYPPTGSSNNGPLSLESNTAAPISALITQTITVTRPAGALVLTQACAGSDPYPDTNAPVGDVSDVVYPTNCTFDLGTATLVKTGALAGQYFQATGAMRQVTIVDTRDTDPGWNATGTMGDFSTGGVSPKTFSGNDMYWAPAVTDKSAPFTSPDGSYAMTVTAGPTPAQPLAAGLAGGSGLHNPGSLTLATGAMHDGIPSPGGPVVHGGLGITHLDAPLTLFIPIFAKTGTYTGILTITAL